MRYTYILVLALLALFAACGSGQANVDPAAHEAAVLEWRADRLKRLKGPVGYLNLAGLFWLEPGLSSFGSSPGNDLVFPQKAPAKIGEFRLDDEGVSMTTEPGVDVYWDEATVSSLRLHDDNSDNPMLIRHGSLGWMVIKRANQYGVRLRDYEHPALESFPPLEYFSIDPGLRLEGRFRAYDEPRTLNVRTVIEGLGYHPQSRGVVEFEIDGDTFDLEAYESGERLFFVFGDTSSGKDTYPAGRFLYADQPDERGRTVLDFNKAYNPPCAFNDFATCPVASPRNRLKVRIAAGEKYDPSVHATPGSKH